jgi:lipoprotein-anchoring transpeptidase ErfK/SrfK
MTGLGSGSRSRRRRAGSALALSVLGVSLLSACSSGHRHTTASDQGSGAAQGAGAAGSGGATTTSTTLPSAQALAAGLAITPSNQATGVSLDTPVSVVASVGTIQSVSVSGASAGDTLTGTLSADGTHWSSSGTLVPGETYTVTVMISPGSVGNVSQVTSTFSTVKPTASVGAEVFPTPGITVGVGQPIVINFSQPVDTAAAQQAVLSHLQVAMSQPVPGGWHWFSSTELHFRPTNFWPTGDQVKLEGDLTGWEAATGVWGSGPITTQFVIGDSHVATANLSTHEMTVTDNGSVVATWPISAGSTEYPTQDGTHLVLDRESVVHMVSSTVGIPVKSPQGYDEYVYWDVHISDSGEYVHAAPWSVGVQGITNVSHGCINLSPSRAETFMHFSKVGDVVQVVGGVRPPLQGDHGVMDWSFDSAGTTWAPATVVQLTTPVTTVPTTQPSPPPTGAPPVTPVTLKPTTTTTSTTTTSTTTTVPRTTSTVAPTTTAAPATTAAPTTAPPTTVAHSTSTS